MNVTILLLAAGASSRMGGADKLAQEINGEPLLRRSTRTALDSKCDVIVVTTPERMVLIEDLPVQLVTGGETMSDSLRAGLANIDADAVIISLADMPDIIADHYQCLIEAHDPSRKRLICRATSETGKPGHPVLFDVQFIDELMQISGDIGPKSVIQRYSDMSVNIPTSDDDALIDLDTPEDWANYRK